VTHSPRTRTSTWRASASHGDVAGTVDAGEDRARHRADRLRDLAQPEGRAAADPPQLELVALAGAELLRGDGAEDDARADEEGVGRRHGGEAGEAGGDEGGGAGPQQELGAGPARRLAGRVVEPAVVLGDRDERARAVGDDLAAPRAGEGLHRVVEDPLHGMRALGRIGEVAGGEIARQRVGGEDVFGVRHGGDLFFGGGPPRCFWDRDGGFRWRESFPPVQARAFSKVRSGRRYSRALTLRPGRGGGQINRYAR